MIDMLNRQQSTWCVVTIVCMCGFSYLLASYTANLEKPGLMFAMIFVGHLVRVYCCVRYDLHAQSIKEVGLLSIVAVVAVANAMILRPLLLGRFFEIEAREEMAFLVSGYKDYFVAVHNPVFGVAAFYVAASWVATKLIRIAGNHWSVLAYPRSSLELYGAYYEAASLRLSIQAHEALEADARSILSTSKGFYTGPSPNRLL